MDIQLDWDIFFEKNNELAERYPKMYEKDENPNSLKNILQKFKKRLFYFF
jgi:hypothetical protein